MIFSQSETRMIQSSKWNWIEKEKIFLHGVYKTIEIEPSNGIHRHIPFFVQRNTCRVQLDESRNFDLPLTLFRMFQSIPMRRAIRLQKRLVGHRFYYPKPKTEPWKVRRNPIMCPIRAWIQGNVRDPTRPPWIPRRRLLRNNLSIVYEQFRVPPSQKFEIGSFRWSIPQSLRFIRESKRYWIYTTYLDVASVHVQPRDHPSACEVKWFFQHYPIQGREFSHPCGTVLVEY